MTRTVLMVVVGLLALVTSPFYGCGAAQHSGFDYGADEMRTAVEGEWVLTQPDGHEIRFGLSQAGPESQTQTRAQTGFVAEASACGQRTFVRSASACIDETTMPLDVAKIAGLDDAAKASGVFSAGASFRAGGLLDLDLGDLSVRAAVSPTGEVSDLVVDQLRDTGATLARVER